MEGINSYFCYGAFYGFIVAGIMGFIFSQIRAANVRMGQQNRTLNTFSDAVQPRMTPAGIVRNSIVAMFTCVFWIIVLIVVITLLIRVTPHLMN